MVYNTNLYTNLQTAEQCIDFFNIFIKKWMAWLPYHALSKKYFFDIESLCAHALHVFIMCLKHQCIFKATLSYRNSLQRFVIFRNMNGREYFFRFLSAFLCLLPIFRSMKLILKLNLEVVGILFVHGNVSCCF